ncbi:DNA helicase RecQ [Luteolibacter yonseiensis]|uniref:DNA helicase RecQ n=1 Tax=Luteolibacter yonseiensis TaxID=1144680 RepID=A0A934R322_9BACT|nr:DNA helicase RecQ [Luteolibacter yonseiensis]MBK1815954.1 DNA helicase RecQ [Luteolibacter yonseiensis]
MSLQLLSSRLKQTFGYNEFRPLQREIMEASLGGRDTVAILPTGAGKSLCYQLPALVREGLTVVVSPLIALMKDQVDQLEASGVAATFLNSTLDSNEARRRTDGLAAGEYQLLYVAPERLMLPDFLMRLRNWKIAALAVDEAHCISEWGHDFRPEYRRLREVRGVLPEIPVLALTATATGRVREDIIRQLELRDPAVFLASFNRPNLKYQVVGKSGAAAQVCNFVNARPDESGIVYCQSRKNTESMAATLRAQGFSAVAYHAGLDAEERANNQEAFLRDEAKIVCATVAFGMGINKPNVRYVIHADMPKNIEGYYQETGRAGRDGLPSDCLLLFSRGDVTKYLGFIDAIPDEHARAVAHEQLDQMAHFAESDTCRRVTLMGYFGESWPLENCGGCDHCLSPREKWDATTDVQKLLSCVLRIRQAGGFSVGMNHLSEVLTGGMSEKIVGWKHHLLTTHGIGKDQPRDHWVDLGRQLLRLGLLVGSRDKFSTISVTQQGIDTLKRRDTVMLTRSLNVAKSKAARTGDIPCDTGLFERLRSLRKELADARNIPPYVVFSDVTLRHCSRDYPQNDAALLRVPGVGEKKLDDFGRAFIDVIRDWLSENERLEFAPLEIAASAPPVSTGKGILSGTAAQTFDLFSSGRSIEEIAAMRDLAVSTVEGHLGQAVESGKNIDPHRLYTVGEEEEMRAAFEGYDEPTLKPVFEQLEGRISYGKLRFYRAANPPAAVMG